MTTPTDERRADEGHAGRRDGSHDDIHDDAPRFILTSVELDAGTPEAYMHPDDARDLGIRPDDRVHLAVPDMEHHVTAIISTARNMVRKGMIAGSAELMRLIKVKTPVEVSVAIAPRPRSVAIIHRKLDGHKLTDKEIRTVLDDISYRRLSPVEITAWATATYVHELDMDEIVASVHAMVDAGETVEFDRGPIMDVHSIGGVPGNKYAPVAVSIVASQGLFIPKTSSRAISSACGTADFMEVFCPVEMTAKRIREITETVGGVLAWGGGVNLAPADDEIIRVEYPLGLDPRSQLLSSVMAKKLAVGAQNVVIDIPVGPRNKVQSEKHAQRLAHQFIDIADRLDMDLQVMITNGTQPIGHAVGPILEAREALETLKGDGPKSLVEKAVGLAGRLLEMGNAAPQGTGDRQAQKALEDGAALATFRRIVAAQGGDPDVEPEALVPGQYVHVVESPVEGIVEDILNDALTQVARAAGSPRDKGAGILLHNKRGRQVDTGEPLYTIHAEHESKLRQAMGVAKRMVPVRVEGMVVRDVVS